MCNKPDDASCAKVRDAARSLDPSWMIRWFERHREKLSPLNDWVRGPSRTAVAQLTEVVAQGRILAAFPSAVRGNNLSDSWWRSLENSNVVQLVNQQLAQELPEAPACEDVDRIDRRCPGFSTAIRLLHFILRDSMGAKPRTLRESDFADALHAMYAPYVDIFRADRYMAPHIGKLMQRRRTTIVGRLEDLPAAIEQRLAEA
jgi:hypothetical protein